MNKVVLFCICLFSCATVQAQGLENDLFNAICKQIAKQNHAYSLKEALKGKVYVLYDPINNVTSLRYEDTSDDATKAILHQYSHKKLLRLLSDYDVQIQPVKNTIVIADTTGLFSKKFTCRIDDTKYKTITTIDKQHSAYIYKSRIKDDKIIVAIAVAGTEDLIIFSFTYIDGKLKFVKKSLADIRPHYG